MKNISRGMLLAADAAISVNASAQNHHPAAQPRLAITVVNGSADAEST